MQTYDEPVRVDHVPGDATGLSIPAHPQALRAAGADFLTEAFRAFGSIARDNRVLDIVRIEPFAGGSTGQKLILDVEYVHDEPRLPRRLFAKFSRDFSDAFRDRRRGELEAEIRLAELSRHPAFPIAVPKAAFADVHHASGTGLLIAERIGFGERGIEPLRHKCMDHELAEPFAYYRAILTALAKLAAAHKSGRLSPDLDRLFPFESQRATVEDPIPYSEAQLLGLIGRYRVFVDAHPQLMPEHLRAPIFIDRLEREALLFLRHETAVKRYLHADPNFIALGHFNANIDNAWFWRDATGALSCGLFDWQRARQMNLGYALWGGLCGAELSIWDHRLDELIGVFLGELAAGGGPRLDRDELKLHLDLYAATMGLAQLVEAPALVLSRLPEAATASGPQDPVFGRSEAARSFLHVFTAWLNLWARRDFGASLDRVLASAAAE
jgi:hypothetical protein